MKVHNKAVIAKLMAKETLKLLTDPRKMMNDECPVDRHTAVLFIAEFTKMVLDSVLNDQPLKYEPDGEDMYNHVHSNYSAFKTELGEKIGAAFTVSVQNFAGGELDYVCEIYPMPERNKDQDN